MKLRLRSLESKETLRIEVPNTCNLQQLKQIIILQLFPSSSSSSTTIVQHNNLVLSLNRKDQLSGVSPDDSLQSLGVTSGDLIYYTHDIYAFSSPNPILLHIPKDEITPGNEKDVNLEDTQVVKSSGLDEIVSSSVENRVSGDTQLDETSKLIDASTSNAQMMESERLNEGDGSNVGTREAMDDEKAMEVSEGSDEMEVDDEFVSNVNTRFSVPGFLKKVFVKEVGDDAANGVNHKLLVIAVHAVLLESGFVCYDPISGMKVDGFHLPDVWPSSGFSILLHYTLPVISSYEVVETVVLKFQTTGKFVNVYGALSRKQGEFHRVCLDEHKLTPALNYVWKKSYYADFEKEGDGSVKLYPNGEIFEFWKIVKDGLSYPLLIELCEQVGLVPPPCLMLLPTELKLKILEALPAIDVARVACVSSEMHFVASSNDLWKMKYEEEFGNAASSKRERQWKADFSSAWQDRKKKKRMYGPLQWREPPYNRPFFPGRRAPNPLPFVIGGDYDRMPGFGIPQPPGRRIFRRNCDLGGFGV